MTAPGSEPVGTPEGSRPGGLVAVRPPGGRQLRLRLDIAYDGTSFCGWARQPGLRSVQGDLESALRAALRIDPAIAVRVAVAGRTDAGVHATGQVCHADVPAASWSVGAGRSGLPVTDAVGRRCNGLLAHDLRVRHVAPAPPGFDARWSASWRRYRYVVADSPRAQDPLMRGHVLWHGRGLDVGAMDAAAASFVGEHDFAAFCRAREGASSVRTIHEIGWRRSPGSGDREAVRATGSGATPTGTAAPAQFEIRADAFCHSMVRSLVGAFLAVGEGRWPTARPAELLVAGIRVPAIPTAPAHGLTLVEVGYPMEADLADQAERARRWRGR